MTPRPKLPPVVNPTLRRGVAATLRRAILEGSFPPGYHMVETELATQLRVSRAPLREALTQLEQEGLIESFPHRGAVVVGMTEADIDAIYELRATIEKLAITRACDLMTYREIADLEAILDDMRARLADGDIEGVIDADIAFHRAIVQGSGYTVLKRIWDSLDGILRVRSLQVLERPSGRGHEVLADSAEAHARLLALLAARDKEACASLIQAQILAVGVRLKTDLVSGDDTRSVTTQ